MSTKPDVQYDTFFKNEGKIDAVSKFFIFAEMLLGVNRLPVLGKINPLCLILVYIHSLFIFIVIVLCASNVIYFEYYGIIIIIEATCMLLTLIISSVSHNRLCNYFIKLSLFDNELGFNFKFSPPTIASIVQYIVTAICIPLYVISFCHIAPAYFLIALFPMKLLHAVDYFFNGHLLELLVTRLRLINYCIELSYPHGKRLGVSYLKQTFIVKKRTRSVKMGTIITYYYDFIEVFDVLYNSLKWQLLLSVIKTIFVCLGDLYFLMSDMIAHKWTLSRYLLSFSIAVIQFVPMFSVCIFGDALHKEVLQLRDRLSCRLYEYKLDKQDRRDAQALLTLTEARNMSLSLFHMFNVDIALPFKILGILTTYLIIMLQFAKVNSVW